MAQRVVVVGAGIIGTSTALRLIESCPNLSVTLISDKFSPNTTGDGAAGIWEPFVLRDTPIELQRKWSKLTWNWLLELLKRDDAHLLGLSVCSGYNLFDVKTELPDWHDLLPDCRMLTKEELERMPEKYQSGFFMTTLMCEPLYYLPWLMKRYKDLGGEILQKEVKSFEELKGYDIVVNCTGMGARKLCEDMSVEPVRGQVMRVKAPWIRHFYLTSLSKTNEVSYIIPNNNTVVLGGTVQQGNFSLDISPVDKEHIIRETTLMEPTLKHAEVLSDWVGQRPSRPQVRLELEVKTMSNGDQLKIVHNYGHGGAGVTVHWGCAADVVNLVRVQLSERRDQRNLLNAKL